MNEIQRRQNDLYVKSNLAQGKEQSHKATRWGAGGAVLYGRHKILGELSRKRKGKRGELKEGK